MGENIWIGLSSHSRGFQWVDGESVESRMTDWSPGALFLPAQPDETGTACVRISTFASDWFDEPCSMSYGFVCEYTACRLNEFSYESSCYLVKNGPTAGGVWQQAATYCSLLGQSSNYHLATIESAGEQEVIASNLAQYAGDFWIGLHFSFGHEKWVWDTVPLSEFNISSDFSAFNGGQPTSGFGSCVAIERASHYDWQNRHCNTVNGFICEYRDPACGPDEHAYNSLCIKVVDNESLSFDAVYLAACYSHGPFPFGANMVEVADPQKQVFLEGILDSYSGDFWIDFKYDFGFWRNGFQVWNIQNDYTNFDVNRPNGSSQTETGNCGSGLETYPNSESCYELFSYTDSWVNANATCRDSGGWLVIVDDNEENQYLIDMGENIWIGLSSHSGGFQWVDGESVESRMTDWSPGALFLPAQPDETGTACVRISTFASDWFDEPCSMSYGFVCEYTGYSDSTILPTTTSMQTTYCETSSKTQHMTQIVSQTSIQATDQTTVMPATPAPFATTKTATPFSSILDSTAVIQQSAAGTANTEMSTSKPSFIIGTAAAQSQNNTQLAGTLQATSEANNSKTTFKSQSILTTGFYGNRETSLEHQRDITSSSRTTYHATTESDANGDRSGDCPAGMETYPTSESCYRKSGYSDTWENAKDNCSADGGWLVIIDDEDENAFVDDLWFFQKAWIVVSAGSSPRSTTLPTTMHAQTTFGATTSVPATTTRHMTTSPMSTIVETTASDALTTTSSTITPPSTTKVSTIQATSKPTTIVQVHPQQSFPDLPTFFKGVRLEINHMITRWKSVASQKMIWNLHDA
ncbi:C-type mannose receptor 2-like [Ptychodera flava]|uniref:C-type mannose receptor 2-like n=1 Tax=Ptychodera flava TaxID=63121 RepID=UPI00396A9E6D